MWGGEGAGLILGWGPKIPHATSGAKKKKKEEKLLLSCYNMDEPQVYRF